MGISVEQAARGWQRLAATAVLVILCLLALGLWIALAPAGMTPRTLQAPGAAELAGQAPLSALLFYLGDSLYAVLAFCLYLGLAGLATAPRGLVAVGLAAAALKAGADLTENLVLTWPALTALLGRGADPLATDWLWLIGDLKRLGGALSALFFALVYPGGAPVKVLLYLTAAVTAAGFLVPSLGQANAAMVFFLAAGLIWEARRRAAS